MYRIAKHYYYFYTTILFLFGLVKIKHTLLIVTFNMGAMKTDIPVSMKTITPVTLCSLQKTLNG